MPSILSVIYLNLNDVISNSLVLFYFLKNYRRCARQLASNYRHGKWQLTANSSGHRRLPAARLPPFGLVASP
jgi:hypothetical protein